MSQLRVLILEDQDDKLLELKKVLDEEMPENDIQMDIKEAKNLEIAEMLLKENNFQLAILDLRINLAERGMNGNNVIELITKNQVMPIIINTAFPGMFEDDKYKRDLIYVCKKDIDDLVKKIVDWRDNKVFDFFTNDGKLAIELHDTLIRTMWDHMGRYWYSLPLDEKKLNDIAGRMATTLLHDDLSCRSESGVGEVNIFHGEIYIFSTPRKYLATGDVIRLDGKRYIVLTPSCDLIVRESGKPAADRLLLAEIKDLKEYFGQNNNCRMLLEQINSKPISDNVEAEKERRKNQETAYESLDELMRHSYRNEACKCFFLPPFSDFTGAVVNFSKIEIIDYSRNDAKKYKEENWIVALNREVVAELAARYGRYISRIGQPAYLQKYLRTAVLDEVNPGAPQGEQ